MLYTSCKPHLILTHTHTDTLKPLYSYRTHNRFDDFYNVGWRVPSFLDSISHLNPSDINNGPFQHAHGFSNKSLYTVFNEDAAMGERFGGMIQMYNAGKPFFWENGYYPFKERLVVSGPTSDEEVLLVDIGGGDAGDLGLLKKALGDDVKGRLVLQELKHIVDRSKRDGFEAHVGDWNEVQPVKGSSPYSRNNPMSAAITVLYRCQSLYAPAYSP